MIPITRRQVGPKFNEGARLLWRVMKTRNWTQAHLRHDIEATPGCVHRWLYGDYRPSLTWSLVLEKKYAIPVTAWVQKPTRPFTCPALAA